MITLPVSRDEDILDLPERQTDLRVLAWLAARASTSDGGRQTTISVRTLSRMMDIGHGAAQSALRRLSQDGYIDILPGKGRAPSVVQVHAERRSGDDN